MNIEDIKYATHSREPFFRLASQYVRQGMRVLDVGAGDGLFADLLGLENIYLIEGNIESVAKLKKKFINVTHINLPGIIPFEDNYFDFIHCSHLVEHLQPSELYEHMAEMNRLLNINGYLVISAPLLWEGFYEDLSHVKPYPPQVFINYMCGVTGSNRTRPIISTQYKVEKIQYRYLSTDIPNIIMSDHGKIKGGALKWFLNFMQNYNLKYYTKTGYTLILQKSN